MFRRKKRRSSWRSTCWRVTPTTETSLPITELLLRKSLLDRTTNSGFVNYLICVFIAYCFWLKENLNNYLFSETPATPSRFVLSGIIIYHRYIMNLTFRSEHSDINSYFDWYSTSVCEIDASPSVHLVGDGVLWSRLSNRLGEED